MAWARCYAAPHSILTYPNLVQVSVLPITRSEPSYLSLWTGRQARLSWFTLHLPLTKPPHGSGRGELVDGLDTGHRSTSSTSAVLKVCCHCPFFLVLIAVSGNQVSWLPPIGHGSSPKVTERRTSVAIVRDVQSRACTLCYSPCRGRMGTRMSSLASRAGQTPRRTAIRCISPCTFLGRNRWSTRFSSTVLVRSS